MQGKAAALLMKKPQTAGSKGHWAERMRVSAAVLYCAAALRELRATYFLAYFAYFTYLAAARWLS